MAHSVVITGIGLITPLGNSTQATWDNLIAGKSGIQKIPESMGLGDYPVSIAGLVTNEQPLLDIALPPKQHSRTDRFIHLAAIAGHEAMHNAGLANSNSYDRARFGVYMGVGIGGLRSISDGAYALERDGLKRVSPFIIPKAISNMAPAWLSLQWNLQGPMFTVTSACASGTDAVGLAFRQIRDGYADAMLAGGTESCIIPITIGGFGNMRALAQWQGSPETASRPFDAGRQGFVIAEGACVLVLERKDKAIARGATLYGEIVGYGNTADAYHMTAMQPEGKGAIAAMQYALTDAGITPQDVGYINAHGTGTAMNDIVESVAIKTLLGAHADKGTPGHCVVSSTKSMTGHMLGATGATEVAFTALALKNGILPPTINLDTPAEGCELDYIPHTARRSDVQYGMSNSFGFGGNNAVVVVKKM